MQPTTHCVEPREAHTHTVIFLHGRDSVCEEFANEFFESEASEPADQPRTLPDLLPTVRWVFPGAPLIRSKRFDTEMSQWFDIWSLEDPEEQADLQKSGLRRGIDSILDLVEKESALVPMGKIFLAGISQGFATSIATVLSTSKLHGLAGLLGVCSWMPPAAVIAELAEEGSPIHQKSNGAKPISTPVFLAHAADDDIINVKLGRQLRERLDTLAATVEWHEYDSGGHWFNEPQGVDDMLAFLKANMR